MQATGISFGLERLSQLAEIEIQDTGVLILSIGQDEQAIKLAENLRDSGISCQIMYGKITKGLEYANSKQIAQVIFVGEKEVSKKKFKLKDMKTGKSSFVSEKELIEKLV